MLLLAALAAAAVLLWARVDQRRGVLDRESERLQAQVLSVDRNLTRQLQGIHAALRGLLDDLPAWSPDERAMRASTRLDALRETMPGVRLMQWVDASGRVVASSQGGAIGQDVASSAWFRQLREPPGAGLLRVSEPFLAAPGLYSLNLSLAAPGPGGGFGGAVSATVDPAFFDTILGSVLYAPDMWSAIVHGQGTVLVVHPDDPKARGLNLARPDTLFTRHLQTGRQASVQRGRSTGTGDERMLALRTLRPQGLPMDQPLVLGVSRRVDDLLAPWRHQSELLAGLWLALSSGAAVALAAVQRRRADRAQLASALHERELAEAERLRLALHGGDLALWDADLRHDRGQVNDRWWAMLGMPPQPDGASDAVWRALLHPDDAARVLAAQQAHVEGRTDSYEAIYRLRHRDGHWVWVLDRGRVVERDAGGVALRMVGTHMDITERMLAEQALRRSEESLSITLQSIGDAVIATDAGGRVTRVNDTARRLTGWPGDSAIGQPLREVFRILNAQTREPELDPVARVLESGQVVGLANGTVLVARDGSERQIADSAAPIRMADGSVAGVVLVFSDVSEQYRVVQALRLSEARMRLAGRLARLGGWRVELPGGEVWLAPESAAIVEVEPGTALVFDPQSTRIAPAHRERLARALRVDAPFDMEVEITTLGGQPLTLRVLGEPVHDASGQLVAMQGALQDVTASRRAEAAVRAAQDELAATLQAVPDLLFDIDIEGLIHSQHSPRSDLLVAPSEQQIGRRVAEVLPAEAATVMMQTLRQAHAQGHAGGLQYALDLPQGRRWFEVSAARKAVAADEVPRCILLSRDVTERVQGEHERLALERQLREAQKIESIGTLAGGIAHDFNNILASILGNAALAREDLPAGHPALASMEQINTAAQRARSLVQQILTFSRREPQVLVKQPLQRAVEETLSLLRATLPATVRLDTAFDAAPLLVQADATQLQQVVMNLCTNAWHALPEGRGRIEVGLAPMDAAAVAELAPGGSWSGPCAHLWVADNGSGIDEATRERVFDPFFTTKPVGQGTGLGLSVVHGIVRGHGGRIVVDTSPGRGSTFHVLLPLADAQADGVPDDAVPGVGPGAGAGRHVLYVDDDEVMALMAQRLLQRAGWQVSRFASAAQALAVVRAEPRRFDIVVTDHNMPEMSGTEFAAQLAQLRPALPVIISSGYITDELRRRAAAAGVRALLQKEQTLESLAGLVHQVLHDLS